jgi:N-acetyl-anhydromuramyl-L-alanine amidase AmpD
MSTTARTQRFRHALLLGLAVVPVSACSTPYDPQRVPLATEPAPPPAPPPIEPAPVVNEAIVVCGRRVEIGTPVVLWTDPPFYDAYQTAPRFAQPKPDAVPRLRYQPGRVHREPNPLFVAAPPAGEPDLRGPDERDETIVADVLVRPNETDARALRDVVDQFVLHFDVCGLSRTCFAVLQDQRNLSVHFLLDVDGTLYQTLDLRDTAWHATKSNTRSIGVEIAQIGAYSAREAWRLDPWYEADEHGTRLTFPERIRETGIRTPDFTGYTARAELLDGRIQGQALQQYDFTPEQYAALAKLAAALCREFPAIRADAPRDEQGAVVDHVLDREAWETFHGILGHYHVQKEKVDPGPAFDWEPFLERVRAELSARTPRAQ